MVAKFATVRVPPRVLLAVKTLPTNILTLWAALQTAVALAEYDAERGEDGVIIITDTHLKAIVDLSANFKKYLNSLHEGDESKRAERKFERLDDFDRKR